MPLPVNIRDAKSGVAASITKNGELTVSPVTPNVSSHHTMSLVDTAYNFGINVHRHIFSVFILSGVISAFTGWLMVARASGATPAMASGFLFEVLAAVIIGGVSMTGGVGSLVGVFAGALLLSSIRSALNILAISPFITEVIRGLLVLVAIVLDSIKKLFR